MQLIRGEVRSAEAAELQAVLGSVLRHTEQDVAALLPPSSDQAELML